MRISLFKRCTAASIIIISCTIANAASITYIESYNVKIPHFSVTLDNFKRDIDISATWHFKDNPTANDYIDSNLVISEIKKYLSDYPNKSDYCEVVNKKLTAHMIERFASLRSITIKIDVPPSKMDPYEHYTEVEAKR